MRLGAAFALFACALLCHLVPAGSISACQTPNQSEGGCPVTLTPEAVETPEGFYAERVTVRVWLRDEDFSKGPTVKLQLPASQNVHTHVIKKKKCDNQSDRSRLSAPRRRPLFSCDSCRLSRSSGNETLWRLETCLTMERYQTVTANISYKTNSSSCAVTYTVPDPKPKFHVSVDLSSKSVNVTVEPGGKVYTRFCYIDPPLCIGGPPPLTIDPAQSAWALVNLTYLLPCIRIEAYFTHEDATRGKNDLFLRNSSLTDVRDVWSSSTLELYDSDLTLSLMCPARDLKISASLCWRQREHLCTPLLNSTLDRRENNRALIFNTSDVDKHPQMCVQFSLQGSDNISCPFPADISSWEVRTELGKQSVFVYVKTSAAGTFSAQLCVLSDRGCAPTGPVTSVRGDGGHAEARVAVPPRIFAERPCVQVWQSQPALLGRRILCPDYTHSRRGMYVVAVLVFVVGVALLGWFIHTVTKNGAAGWLHIQKPVLLVCSSQQSPHVSAACALASVLQGELGATVHMALFAQNSRAQGSVADLGPLPWLYGQWEAVRKAQGKVLIAWSPEARTAYERWRKKRVRERRAKEADSVLKTAGRSKKATGKKEHFKQCDDKSWTGRSEPSTLIEPVFTAALACLEGALQESGNHGVALVCFQGLGHTRDIPKAFRGVPRYCIPEDFGGVIQELGGMTKHTQSAAFRCWPRLTSKVLSAWLARQLAARLRTLLPQTQEDGARVASPPRRGLGFPVRTAKEPGSKQEQEALSGSPWRPQVSSG